MAEYNELVTQTLLNKDKYEGIEGAEQGYNNVAEEVRETTINRETANDLNAYGQQTKFIFEQTTNPVLASKSVLKITGQLVKEDGAQFTRDASGEYPQIALSNNFFPYMFSQIELWLGKIGEKVDSLREPGVPLTIKNLILNYNDFNGEDWMWVPDVYDGAALPPLITNIVSLGGAYAGLTGVAEIVKEPYQLAMLSIIPLISSTLSYDLTNIAAGDIPVAGASPTVNELLDEFGVLSNRIKNQLSNFQVTWTLAEDFPENTVPTFIKAVRKLETYYNINVVNKNILKENIINHF